MVQEPPTRKARTSSCDNVPIQSATIVDAPTTQMATTPVNQIPPIVSYPADEIVPYSQQASQQPAARNQSAADGIITAGQTQIAYMVTNKCTEYMQNFIEVSPMAKEAMEKGCVQLMDNLFNFFQK
jgi:hypothetical protein